MAAMQPALSDSTAHKKGRNPAPTRDVFRFVEQMPEFPGDVNAYIQSHMHYPAKELKAGIEGRVVVQFVVEADGTIGNVEVVRKLSPACDAEALRMVKAMPRWKPGKQNGQPVAVFEMLPVTFRLK